MNRCKNNFVFYSKNKKFFKVISFSHTGKKIVFFS